MPSVQEGNSGFASRCFFSRLVTGNTACIYYCIGGLLVEITITVITNFKAMSALGCEDMECAII